MYIQLGQVIERLLPRASHLNLQPERWVDRIAVPGSYHRWYTTHPLADSTLDELAASSAVRSSGFRTSAAPKAQGRALVLELACEPEDDLWRYFEGYESLYWYLEIYPAISESPKLIPSNEEARPALALGKRVMGLATGLDIRQAMLKKDKGFGQKVDDDIQHLNELSVHGKATFFPISRIDTDIHLIEGCLVVHAEVGHIGPWVIADEKMTDDDVLDVLAKVHPDVEVFKGYKVSESLGGKDVERGRMTVELRTRLSKAIKKRAEENRQGKLHDISLPKPRGLSTAPLVPTLHLVATVSPFDNLPVFTRLIRQIGSMAMNPPPMINDGYSNVGKISIWLEKIPHWRIPIEDRMMPNVLLDHSTHRDIICVVNPTRFAKRTADVPFIERLPSLWSMGLPIGAVADGDTDEARWYDTRGHLTGSFQIFDRLSGENNFYRQVDLQLRRHARTVCPALKDSIKEYMALHGLTVVILRRVSEAGSGQRSPYNRSLDRQRRFLVNHTPTDQPQMITLDQVSIASDGSPVIRELERLENCLVLATTVDRVARNHAALAEIREICKARNIHIVAMLVPPETIRELIQKANAVLNKQARRELQPGAKIGRHEKALPSVWPIIIGAPDLHQDMATEVNKRVQASTAFVAALGSTSFQGDPWLNVPDEIANLPSQRELEAARAGFETALRRTVPNNWIGQVEVRVFTGFRAQLCHCNTTCRTDCVCQCWLCTANWRASRREPQEVAPKACPVFCPCLDHGDVEQWS